MASLIWIGLLSLLGMLVCSCGNHQTNEQPNVILIVANDLGITDLENYGGPYQTPSISKMAQEGVVYTNGYASAAESMPGFASLITGTNVARHRVFGSDTINLYQFIERSFPEVEVNLELPDDIITLPSVFQKNGYQTMMLGNWEFNNSAESCGFDIHIGGNSRKDFFSHFSPYGLNKLDDGPRGEYLSDRLTTEAISLINKSKDPFFLCLNLFPISFPIQAKSELIKKYRKLDLPKGKDNPAYAATIEALDNNIGRIDSYIEHEGLSENTIVILTSVNGGIASISKQNPYRAGKGSYFEGGLRVPYIIKWDKHFKDGVENEFVVGTDIFPTLIDACNLSAENCNPDGVSLLPLLSSQKKLERDILYWYFPVYHEAYNPLMDEGIDPYFRTRPGMVVRQGKWKLHYYFENRKKLLYDLDNDSGERVDVSDKYPEIVTQLFKQMKELSKQQDIIAEHFFE